MAEQQQDETARKREHEEAAKKRLADERQAREKVRAEQHDMSAGAVKPTPTQEENDLAALGVHVIDKEPDGSPPDPAITATTAHSTSSTRTRQVEAEKPAARSYPTRSQTATPHSS